MKLYTRAALGVIAAFVLTYAVLGFTKSYIIDPARRQSFLDIAGPALRSAARQLNASADRGQTLQQLRVEWGGLLEIESIDRREASGLLERGDSTYAFQRLDDGSQLVYGPLPTIDPHRASVTVIGLGTPVLLAAVIAFLIVAPVVGRIRSLARVTERLAEGDLSARTAEPSTRDVLSDLARRFNQMATEIEQLVNSKQELLQAVSHEFRTPSSRIRFELEMLEGAGSEEERRRRIDSIDQSLVELDELVDELLVYARFDGNPPELMVEDVDPAAIGREIAEELEGLREQISIRVSSERSAHVSANLRYFRRALRNLLWNACRYADSWVELSIRPSGSQVVIVVTDDGPGIPVDQRARIFEPFARLEGSRGREHGGAGLGLAIVSRICRWHGATVEAAESASGARLVMTWPSGGEVAASG